MKRIASIVMAMGIFISAVGCSKTDEENNPNLPKNYSNEKD